MLPEPPRQSYGTPTDILRVSYGLGRDLQACATQSPRTYHRAVNRVLVRSSRFARLSLCGSSASPNKFPRSLSA